MRTFGSFIGLPNPTESGSSQNEMIILSIRRDLDMIKEWNG